MNINKSNESQQINSLQSTLEDLLNNIPDKFLKSFTKRSIRDAKELVGNDFQLDDEELQDIAYSIYKAYCIGFTIGNMNKTHKK